MHSSFEIWEKIEDRPWTRIYDTTNEDLAKEYMVKMYNIARYTGNREHKLVKCIRQEWQD